MPYQCNLTYISVSIVRKCLNYSLIQAQQRAVIDWLTKTGIILSSSCGLLLYGMYVM